MTEIVSESPIDTDHCNEASLLVGTTEVAFKRLSKQEKKEIRKKKLIEVKHKKYDRQKARKKLKAQEELIRREQEKDETHAEIQPIIYGPRKKDILADRLRQGIQSGVKLCIDLGYDETIHNYRERCSLVKQLTLCYAYLKQSNASVHLNLTSVSTGSALFEKMHLMGFENWFASIHEKSPERIWDPSSIVILSPDADEVLEDVEDGKVYVIGGIVDRTVKKSTTLSTAIAIGAKAKRLPLKEFVSGGMVTHILNVDHVFRILCDYCESKNWQDAICKQVPQRRMQESASTAVSDDL